MRHGFTSPKRGAHPAKSKRKVFLADHPERTSKFGSTSNLPQRKGSPIPSVVVRPLSEAGPCRQWNLAVLGGGGAAGLSNKCIIASTKVAKLMHLFEPQSSLIGQKANPCGAFPKKSMVHVCRWWTAKMRKIAENGPKVKETIKKKRQIAPPKWLQNNQDEVGKSQNPSKYTINTRKMREMLPFPPKCERCAKCAKYVHRTFPLPRYGTPLPRPLGSWVGDPAVQTQGSHKGFWICGPSSAGPNLKKKILSQRTWSKYIGISRWNKVSVGWKQFLPTSLTHQINPKQKEHVFWLVNS